ncbi:hypothetical protein [Bauldia sp.]|uniref:hypothetical protein n=1 Tax=Bauldia sp. TaxID=2575872 RepID=UPI003BAC2F5F
MSAIVRLVALVGVACLPALAEAEEPPDLTGAWVTLTGEVSHWEGGLYDQSGTTGTLIVEEQFRGVFRGTMTWANDIDGPEFQGAAGIQHLQSENVVGAIGFDNETVYWADHEDETTYRARLVNRDTMEVIALEAGPFAVATRTIMIRQD